LIENMRNLLCIGLLLCACNSGSDSDEGPFGLEQRRTVTGVTFPTGLPQPTPLNTVVAFPNVSFPDPVFLTVAPGDQDNLYVVEQDGRIQVFENDPTTSTKRLFLDIAIKVNSSGSEEGLLGLAFDPDYETNGYFYVNYTASSPRRTVIARYTATGMPLAGDASTEQILLEFDQPEPNHNGGMLAFGRDGMLYIATGDGGGSDDPDDNAQSLGNLLGKILRIHPSGSIPPDNPFVGVLGAREEIWAYGLRNPWRFSFDRDTGTLWAGDVGQYLIEEIDIIVKGANYGWRVYEGDRSNINPGSLPATDFTAPVHTYPHPTGFAIVGGYVYRGDDLPSLVGAYVYADNVTGRVWALVHDGNQVISNRQVGSLQSPSSFGQDHDGEIYICNLDDNRIYHLEERSVMPPAIPQTLSDTGLFANTANLTPSLGLIEYDVNAPLWTDGAEKRYWLALPGSARIGFHPTEAWDFPVGTVIVKHFELAGQRVETRVLVHATSGWQGFSYRWNQAQDDADLLSGSLTENINGQDWYFPSRADCLTCHNAAAGDVLGIRTRQLNRDFDYPALTDNQLRSWRHIQLFMADIGDFTRYEALADPSDTAATTDERARAYLQANCSFCHLPNGPAPVDMDLRYGLPIAQMRIVGVPAVAGGTRVNPGSSATSLLWERMSARGLAQMPPLATNLVDTAGADLLALWIDVTLTP
jgi:uncharacterized repeat protein (TIGR03806 family)